MRTQASAPSKKTRQVILRKKKPEIQVSEGSPSRSNYHSVRLRKEFPRFVARIAPELKQGLEFAAQSDGISVTKLFEDIIRTWLSEQGILRKL